MGQCNFFGSSGSPPTWSDVHGRELEDWKPAVQEAAFQEILAVAAAAAAAAAAVVVLAVVIGTAIKV